MNYSFTIALRSLLYRKKQYISLFLVCLFGVGISLFCLFLVRGMMAALTTKARIYYGGDFQFVGGEGSLSFDAVEPFLEKLDGVFGDDARISARFDLDARQAQLYFEGEEVRQRVIKGVDFTRELPLFSRFNYVAGGVQTMAGSNGILLSKPLATKLSVSVGDTVTLMLRTAQGYINTVELTVQGIFKDSSLFGMYTSYMDIDCLRNAYGAAATYANRICIAMPEEPTEKDAARYQERLSKRFKMFPLVADKQLFYDVLDVLSEPTYALIPLNANLQEVQVLINAMRWISSFVIVMLIIIIVAGIGSTYRVLVMKRINEIGIYMAIGMKKTAILALLLLEALFLLLAGCASGIALALLLTRLVSYLNFSFIPAFDIFLTDGSLMPLPHIATTCNLLAVVIFCTMIAVMYSVLKSIRIMPVQALTVTE